MFRRISSRAELHNQEGDSGGEQTLRSVTVYIPKNAVVNAYMASIGNGWSNVKDKIMKKSELS